MVGAGFSGYFFSPAVPVEARLIQVALGFMLLFGLATRVAALGVLLLVGVFSRAAALGALGVFTLTLFGLPDDPVLAHLALFGLASSVVITGSGPLGLDRRLATLTGAVSTESDSAPT